MSGFAGVLAHQGGWDEALMVALPLGLFAVLLRVATVRADRLARTDPATDTGASTGTGTGTGTGEQARPGDRSEGEA